MTYRENGLAVAVRRGLLLSAVAAGLVACGGGGGGKSVRVDPPPAALPSMARYSARLRVM